MIDPPLASATRRNSSGSTMIRVVSPSPPDISVSFPTEGVVRLASRSLFGDADDDGDRRRFLERVFRAPEVQEVTIHLPRGDREVPRAELRFRAGSSAPDEVVNRIAAHLAPDRARDNGRASPRAATITKVVPARRNAGERLRFFRHGTVVTDWEVKHELPGRIRLKNPALLRRGALCRAIERELLGVLGIDSYKTSSTTGTVLIHYDPRALSRDQVIQVVDDAMARAEPAPEKDALDLELPLATLSMPVAAAAQYAAPALMPIALAMFAYTSIPTFKDARTVLLKERRLGVDALDAVVVLGCLGTASVFPGALLCWCLAFGRTLVRKTRDNSRKLLVHAFGKQPRFVRVHRDGVEEKVEMDRLEVGDLIIAEAGEVIPVDGIVVEGLAMIDQHVLTGESAPAEKGVGDRVFASTLMLAGGVLISVEQSGEETASARIAQILGETAGYTLHTQSEGERLADKAVMPTLALGAVGMATQGPFGAMALLNSDFGTGIRMAAPLAMLSTLALCASRGILVKDGRALEEMHRVDTVVFDKTGTLTLERPEVARVVADPESGLSADEVLYFAAAAEARFHHPIALAILHEAERRGLELPPADDSLLKVGKGIAVHVAGRLVRVGSRRFLEQEGLRVQGAIREALGESHDQGRTMVLVGLDDRITGGIELHAPVRPEVRDVIRGLRQRGVNHIAIISGDHEAPTKALAESLGVDRYFAQVLPADKAQYVEALQKEGRKVCFIGDGINDSIALKTADASISLRGASSLATDTAHVVFLEQGLERLLDLRDIAGELDRNTKRCWSLILAPNIACILGVFTMGFGITASVFTNNVAAIGALVNAMLPMWRVARAEALQQHELELSRAHVQLGETP